MSPVASAVDKLTTIKNHLSPASSASPPSTSTTKSATAMASRPPITCHVLDTTIGLPAESIAVKLYPASSLSSSSTTSDSSSSSGGTYTGTTNHDGRVTAWHPSSPATAPLDAVFASGEPRDLLWILEFDTAPYWRARGVAEPFFPRVSLQFVTQSFGKAAKGAEAHWHVPLLLGPYNYTTYRGS